MRLEASWPMISSDASNNNTSRAQSAAGVERDTTSRIMRLFRFCNKRVPRQGFSTQWHIALAPAQMADQVVGHFRTDTLSLKSMVTISSVNFCYTEQWSARFFLIAFCQRLSNSLLV